MPLSDRTPVTLFGYDSSPFTNKVKLVLKIKRVSYTYIPVPSTLPRPLLTTTFALPYRKIPILALGRDLYCDTALIIEALEHFFPPSPPTYSSIYPPIPGLSSWSYKPLARGFATFWTDKPLFRLTTGLIPESVWSSHFGVDRAQLVGHGIDAKRVGGRREECLSGVDAHLSVLEEGFGGRGKEEEEGGWVFPTETPSLADVGLYYQIRWGWDMGLGRGVGDLSGGAVGDCGNGSGGGGEGERDVEKVLDEGRYPGLMRWFGRFEEYIAALPKVETRVDPGSLEAVAAWKERLNATPLLDERDVLVKTRAAPNEWLDEKRGFLKGRRVSITPEDTGRGNPTVGTLVAVGVEEVVVELGQGEGEVRCRVHFPRVGFKVRGLEMESKL